MSGHSKWANIKNKKEKTDSQRGKIFTKIGREIAIAVKEGGSDPNNNSKLRDVIAKAKAANVPNDNITRSIKKAAGELGSINYEEKNKELRKEKNANFQTMIPRELFEEINAFLTEKGMTKVDFIKKAFDAMQNNR